MRNNASLLEEISRLKHEITTLKEENNTLKQTEQKLQNELTLKNKEIKLLESKLLNKAIPSITTNIPIPSNESSVCSYTNSKPPKTRLDLEITSKERQTFTKISPLSRTNTKRRDKTAEDTKNSHDRKLSDITRNKKLKSYRRDKSSSYISGCSKENTHLNITGSTNHDMSKEYKTKNNNIKSSKMNTTQLKKSITNKYIIHKILKGSDGQEIPYVIHNSKLPFYNNNTNNINIYSGRIDGEQNRLENKRNNSNSSNSMRNQNEVPSKEESDNILLNNQTNYKGQSFGIANLKVYGFPKNK